MHRRVKVSAQVALLHGRDGVWVLLLTRGLGSQLVGAITLQALNSILLEKLHLPIGGVQGVLLASCALSGELEASVVLLGSCGWVLRDQLCRTWLGRPFGLLFHCLNFKYLN